MKELREIIKAYDTSVKAGKSSALATVVHLNGSSYRRPGARMLVTEDGEMTGAISGGCLEGDALRKAMMVLSQQQSKLVTYDSSDEEDAIIGMQLGCEGIIQVLFEPLNPNDHNNPVELLRRAVEYRQKSVLVTFFLLEDKRNEQPGTCLLLEENGNISGTIPYLEIKEIGMENVHYAMQQQTSLFKKYELSNISITAFFEFLQPAISLVVIGAGNDAIPMMQIADTLGWDIRVVDGRSTHAKPQRFTGACQVLVSKPEKVLEQIPVDDQTVFVMMTHNYNYDLAMLKALLARKVTYIGMLGPKKKLDRMLDELRDEGTELTEEQLNTIYGPVGLEIGAETAEEIALSIIAEIKAVLSNKSGESLRRKQDVIHSGTDTIVKEKKLH
ncbi:MAG: XdhC/CoxI family protein [Ginsengibacter sp.]